MNEEGYKIKKIIRIIAIILIILLIIIAFYIYIKQNNDKKVKKNLIKLGYKEITSNTFNKKNKETSYNYNIKTKDFSKTINTKTQTESKNIVINTKGKSIAIYYTYMNVNLCKLSQKGTYENNDFKCTIRKKTNSCNVKCDEMYKEIKIFEKEYNELYKDVK